MTTITLTHEGKTYTSQELADVCAGCAFESEPIHHPICNLRDCPCELMDIIWIEQPQQESPLDMPGFKAQKAYNGCEGCAFNECGTNCTAHGVAAKTDCHHTKVIWLRDGCCGQPNTCEQPCFHQSGRTTEGRAGAIAGVPDYNPDDVAFKPVQVMFTLPADKAIMLQSTCNAEGVDMSELMADYAEQMMTTQGLDSAPGILAEAAQTMLERGKQYDQSGGERSFEKAAKVFNAIAGTDYLSASDIALVLLAVKLVRDQSREEPHRDSLLDAVAYASLYAEERLKEGA